MIGKFNRTHLRYFLAHAGAGVDAGSDVAKLDSRQMTELLESEQRQGTMIEQHVEAELATDPQ